MTTLVSAAADALIGAVVEGAFSSPVVQPPPPLDDSGQIDAMSAIAFAFGAFGVLAHLVRFAEGDGMILREYADMPYLLVSAYACLAFGYGLELIDESGNVGRWVIVSLGYVLCVMHAARAASARGGVNLAVGLLTLALAISAAFRTHAVRARNCSSVYVFLSVALSLVVFRAHRRARAGDNQCLGMPEDSVERCSRRRLVATLVVSVLAVALQPTTGGCGGDHSNAAGLIQGALDIIMFSVATELLCV
jgi:hypothetical protein